MFGAVFVEDRVGGVDVDENFAAFRASRELLQKAVWTRQRQMTDFTGGLLAAARLNQLIVAPESAVDEDEVTRSGGFGPFGIAPGKRGGQEDALSFLLENEANIGFFARYRALKFFAHVVRIRAAERHGDAYKCRRFAWTFRKMTTQAPRTGEHLPLHRRVSTI